MDDDRRAAERELARTGAIADEARLLLARLRTEDLDPESFELAARLGHSGAACALGARVELPPSPEHPWHCLVRAALARRLLAPPEPRLVPRAVELAGPPGTNDARRFVLPPLAELRARIAGADPWEVRATYGEGETTLVVGASREPFADLADFWVEVGLPHGSVPGALAEGAPRPALARLLLESPMAPVAAKTPSFDDAPCGQHGFAAAGVRRGFRELLGPDASTRAFRLVERWNAVTDVFETAKGFFIASWSTSA